MLTGFSQLSFILLNEKAAATLGQGVTGMGRDLESADSIEKLFGLDLKVQDTPDARARTQISDDLDRFNDEFTGVSDARALDVLVTDAGTSELQGGLIGRTSLGVLFVNLFFLPAALRGKGIGGKILRLAEEEARRRGCWQSVLFTITFQAPDFYKRHGYREFGRVECNPLGHARVFMVKALD